MSLDGCAEMSIFTLNTRLSDPYSKNFITMLHLTQLWPSLTQLKSHLNPSASWCDPSEEPEAACVKPQGAGKSVEFRLYQSRPFILSKQAGKT